MSDPGVPPPPPPPLPPPVEGPPSWPPPVLPPAPPTTWYPPAPPTIATTPQPYPAGPPPYGPPPAPPAGAPPLPVIRWGLGDVLYGLLLWVVGGIVSTVALFATGAIDMASGTIGELSLGLVAVTLVSGWIGFVGWPIVASWRKGQRSLAKDFGLDIRWIDVGWGLLGGFGALVVSVAGGVLWTVISGDPSPTNAEFLPSSPGFVGALVLWLLVGVGTPIAEELFFRGLMLRAVARRWSIPVGVVASSIVFGMFHITAFSFAGLFIVFVTASYGVVFAVLAVRANGRLGPSIIAHATVNSVAVLALLLT